MLFSGNQDNLWAIWGNIVADWDNLFKRKLSHIKVLQNTAMAYEQIIFTCE